MGDGDSVLNLDFDNSGNVGCLRGEVAESKGFWQSVTCPGSWFLPFLAVFRLTMFKLGDSAQKNQEFLLATSLACVIFCDSPLIN